MAIPAPIAYYKLDGNAVDSVAGANGTEVSMAYTTGILNNGGNFQNNAARRIILPVQTTLTTNFTISFWLNRTGVGTLQCPLTIGRQTGFGWFYFTTADNFRFVEDNVADYASSITISTTGTWNHIAIVKNGDGASNLTYYLNGSAAGTASVGAVSTPATASYIGAYSADGTNFVYPLNGVIDELYIEDAALTAGQIAELYGSGTPPAYPFSSPVRSNLLMMGVS
jgi:hypothetical protein